MTLESKRVRLRPVIEADISRFLVWYNDPEITDNLDIRFPVTEATEREWLNTLQTVRAKTDLVFVIELKGAEPKIIGNVGIHKIDLRHANAEISFIIGEKDFWGQGLATQATALALEYGFEKLGLHRIYTGAYSFNKRSIRSLKLQGFRQEGVQREAVLKKGRFHDIVLFAMLRSEWEYLHAAAR